MMRYLLALILFGVVISHPTHSQSVGAVRVAYVFQASCDLYFGTHKWSVAGVVQCRPNNYSLMPWKVVVTDKSTFLYLSDKASARYHFKDFQDRTQVTGLVFPGDGGSASHSFSMPAESIPNFQESGPKAITYSGNFSRSGDMYYFDVTVREVYRATNIQTKQWESYDIQKRKRVGLRVGHSSCELTQFEVEFVPARPNGGVFKNYRDFKCKSAPVDAELDSLYELLR